MRTIEKLCQYKDLTDLVYRYVHTLLTQELIHEFDTLSETRYILQDTSLDYPLLYDDTWPGVEMDDVNIPFFNWRSLPSDLTNIYHISHNTKSFDIITLEYGCVVTSNRY